MAEIFPVTEPCCVAEFSRLFGWVASALDETATLKHAINTVSVNRATSVIIARNLIFSPDCTFPPGRLVQKTGQECLQTRSRKMFFASTLE